MTPDKLVETVAAVVRSHWHESGYRQLVRKGLVHWGDPPATFSRRRFAGIEISTFGRLTLSAALAARVRAESSR